MFKFFTGISLKQWLIVGAVLVSAVLLYKYCNRIEQVAELKGVVKEQAVTIAVQKDHIEVDQQLDKIGEQTQVDTQAAVKAVNDKHTSIQARAEQATREVEVRYDSQPVTLENLTARQAELASINIDSLWVAYCAAQPDSPECVPPKVNPDA